MTHEGVVAGTLDVETVNNRNIHDIEDVYCANNYLDAHGVPRGNADGDFSLVGRIRHFAATCDQAKLKIELETHLRDDRG